MTKNVLSCGHWWDEKYPNGCTRDVERYLPCGHTISIPCNLKHAKIDSFEGRQSTYSLKIYPPSGPVCETREIICTKSCLKIMACGHFCKNLCYQQCADDLCPLTCVQKQKCGHEFEIPCRYAALHPDIINKLCIEPCQTTLSCLHQCQGTCGQCFQGRVHIPCRKECGRVQICGHVCNSPCSEICPPCAKKCSNHCPHSRCPHRCGKPCRPCAELCEWKCLHYKCTKLCGEECDREPCNEPCSKILKCGHSCIGLCGEVCPPLCRECNIQELTEFQILCHEQEPDARFVFLQDCGHCIEVRGLDQWMNLKTDEIGMKCCPRCKTTIWVCQRYGNVIRQCFNDVQQVKQQIFGNTNTLLEAMPKLWNQFDSAALIKVYFVKEYEAIKCRLLNENHCSSYNVIENQLNLLHFLAKLIHATDVYIREDYYADHIKPLVKCLMMFESKVNSQDMQAFDQECRRIELNMKMMTFEQRYSHTTLYQNNQITIRIIRSLLHSGKKIDEFREKDAIKFFQKTLDFLQVKLEIVNAIDVGKKGHWFKCPNGHLYAIGECGGAMERAKCPDCGVGVGGINHALDPGNVHSGEMDGSTYPSYSEMANLANYDLDDLE